MTNSLILENRFTTHQKMHLTLPMGILSVFSIYSLLTRNLNLKEYLPFLIITFSIIIICLAFTKRGILKKEDVLYRGLFFTNRLLLKKKIYISDKSKVSILKFKKTQKMAWFSAARPDLASIFNAFDVTLLNEKHTKKEILISLSNEDMAENTIRFLENNFNLEYKIYSPDFS